ncbi:MAG: MMPL family transporter [Pseudomonadota bacterium]
MSASETQSKEYALSSWLGEVVIKYRWLVMGLSILLTMAFASGAPNLRPFDDYRVFFSKSDPRLAEFEKLQNTYTKTDNSFFAITPESGVVFSKDTLLAVEALTEEAWKIPFAIRVDSLTNFQHSTAEGDDLFVRDLVEDASELTESDLGAIREAALSEPLLDGYLVNDETQVTGVNVTFQFQGEALDEQARASSAAKQLAEKIEAEFPVRVSMTGMVMLNDAFNTASIQDLTTLVPLMYLVILIVTGVLLRSFTGVAVVLLVMVLSMMAAMGFGGHLGVVITPPSSVVPTIVAMLAVADGVHFIVTMQSAMRRGKSRQDAIRHSMRLNFAPIFVTSATTAIGFLSMNFSDAPPFHDLGNMAAFGVMWAFAMSVTFLPAFLSLVPITKGAGGETIERGMSRFGEFVIRRRGPIVVVGVVASVALLSFIPRNILSDDFVRYFDRESVFRSSAEYTNDNLTGIYQLQYSLESTQPAGVSDPSFLQEVAEFSDFMRGQEDVRHVNVITDTFRRLNRNMHGDDPTWYRLPDDQNLAAQYLLLYELSLPFGLDLNNQIDIGKTATQIIVTMSDVPAPRMREISEAGEAWLADSDLIVSAPGVGPAVMFAYISDRNIRGMVFGTTIALVMISGILMFMLRSVKVGLISLIPNVLPPALAFGVWGLTFGQVNVAVALVTGLTLGIVVDATVHFLSKYLNARREQGLNAEDAVRYAFSTVGVAILTMSLVIVAGFMILTMSSFGMNELMGQLTAIAIAMALLADFLLLPALLIFLDGGSAGASKSTDAVPAE